MFYGNGPSQDSYPNYAPTGPVYSQPQPPLNTMVPLPPENIVEPPPSVRISDEHSIGRATEAPALPQKSDSNQEYPAVVELRSGSVYTASSYWVSGKTFHFITTGFDHFQVPLAVLEHVSPPRRGQTDTGATTPSRALPGLPDGKH